MKQILIAKALIRHNGKYLLLKKSYGNEQFPDGFWEAAGGKLAPGESPRKGVEREIVEETGLAVSFIAELEPFRFIRENAEYITYAFLFEAKHSDVTLSEEHREYKWVSPHEITELSSVIYKERFQNYVALAEKL